MSKARAAVTRNQRRNSQRQNRWVILWSIFFYEDDFICDNENVKYYTGLPSGDLLREVFKLVVPFPGAKRMYYWKSFIAMMMKLRLNLGLQDLAYRLRFSMSTMMQRYVP